MLNRESAKYIIWGATGGIVFYIFICTLKTLGWADHFPLEGLINFAVSVPVLFSIWLDLETRTAVAMIGLYGLILGGYFGF